MQDGSASGDLCAPFPLLAAVCWEASMGANSTTGCELYTEQCVEGEVRLGEGGAMQSGCVSVTFCIPVIGGREASPALRVLRVLSSDNASWNRLKDSYKKTPLVTYYVDEYGNFTQNEHGITNFPKSLLLLVCRHLSVPSLHQ